MAASIGIMPAEFWGLTPFEFKCAVEGAAERRDSDMQTLAWMQANLINGIRQVKRSTPPIRARQLYRGKNAPPEFDSAETFKEFMRDRDKG